MMIAISQWMTLIEVILPLDPTMSRAGMLVQSRGDRRQIDGATGPVAEVIVMTTPTTTTTGIMRNTSAMLSGTGNRPVCMEVCGHAHTRYTP